MKKFFTFTLFLVFSTFLFAAKINKISMTNNNFIVDLADTKNEELVVSTDEDTRLMYIEILNLDKKSIQKLTTDIEKKMRNSGYFEDITIIQGDNSLSIACQFFQKVSYSIDISSKKIDVALAKSSKNKYLIVIDPGHGGKDPGAVRGKTYEKHIAFAISNYLKNELSKDFNVLLTRNTDIFIKLNERPRMANKNNAKLFVSIHANASENKKANGFEVFYFSKKSSPYAERIANFENSFGEKFGENSSDIAQISGELAYKKNQENSISLAEDMMSRVPGSLGLKNGGVHGANFAVLRGFNGTGVLVEVGFVSNDYDRKIITNAAAQKRMAKELATSIRNYFN